MERSNDESVNRVTGTIAICDSVYQSCFENERELESNKVIKFNELTKDHLIIASDSSEGFFTLQFQHDTLTGPDYISARYLYFDRERRLLHPKVGGRFARRYIFEYSLDMSDVSYYSTEWNRLSIGADMLLDTIEAILEEKFLGDSLELVSFSNIEFVFPKPPTLDEAKYLFQGMYLVESKVRYEICSRYHNDSSSLKFRMKRLAKFTTCLKYDWAERFGFIDESQILPSNIKDLSNLSNDTVIIDHDN